MTNALNGLFVYDIKEIEKALINPENLTLQEIRQLKRELGTLRAEQLKEERKRLQELRNSQKKGKSR